MGAFLSCGHDDEGFMGEETMLFELQFINAGMSGKIIKNEDLEFN